ncbi:MAG: Plug domain-containing protein, partial [Pseudomonadales bacterium]
MYKRLTNFAHALTIVLSIDAALTVGFGLASTARAQDDIEEVVVQGEQTGAEALDDFASITALDAEKLADAGIENVEDAAAYVPNLSLTQTETGTNIFIRGVGSGVNQGFDQSVGLFSDGVPLPRANMARAPFLDLASLQVKRGPQYVLDGNFAIAGSVHMLSNLSLDAFKAGIDINYTPSQNDRTLLL